MTHLKKLEDFNGTFTATAVGGAVGGGGGVVELRNQNGVVMNLVGTSEGMKLTASVDGVKIKLR